jgi:hypothetical protein
LGLVVLTQALLRSLLQDYLGVPVPVELWGVGSTEFLSAKRRFSTFELPTSQFVRREEDSTIFIEK